MKDPYYQKILSGLEQLDNPTAFEECARGLLQDAYTSLASVHGGSDAGMDGAIADGEGEAYPLVATTGKDLARNLRKNLDSYISHGKERRRAVFATSQKVTPKKRRKLETIARDEHGFTLVNVHDRYDFADRLYRNSRWARELLGITGEPSALSAIPLTHRPLADIKLIGRDADIQWLNETRGHRLIVGQPGSGKTALLLQLVRQGKALFLASDDEEKIANACRDSEPAVILVDDAHLDPNKLTRLRQIREEIDANFDIVASGWPGTEDNVANALGDIGSGNIRHLELLTRKEIVEVLRSIGVSEPDDAPYLGLLVDQSANKPGLAVTLGSLWLRGEHLDVLTGKALRRSLIPALKRFLESDPIELLGCFALGGDSGMGMETVGAFLEMPLGEVRRRASLASHGGVLSVHRKNLLAVQPKALRSALLKEAFFTSPSLAYRPLLERAPDLEEAIETLVIAATLGVEIPHEELKNLILESGTPQAWQAFILLGENEGNWVLENYSYDITAIAPQLLQTTPRSTIQRLLFEAEKAEERSHWTLPRTLQLLKDWVQETPPFHLDQVAEILERRRIQVDEAKQYLKRGGDPTTGQLGCFLALSPRLRTDRMTVTGGAVMMRRGILPTSTLPQILRLWSEILADLGELTPESWPELENALRDLWSPSPRGLLPDEGNLDRYRDVARKIVSDLADRVHGRPGLSIVLKEWADRVDLPLEITIDKDFAALFPLTDDFTPENWREKEKEQVQAARKLASRWASSSPLEVSQKLLSFEAQAQGFRDLNSIACGEFAHALATMVETPDRWLETFWQGGLADRWFSPLLRRVVQQRHSGWKRALLLCLESDDHSWLAEDLIIRTKGIPSDLIETALDQIQPDPVKVACLQGRVHLKNLRLLLQTQREEIALAAAVGEWLSEPRDKVQVEIRAEWRDVVIRLGSVCRLRQISPGAEYAFKEILGSDSNLAFDWLLARIDDNDTEEQVRRQGIYSTAIQRLPQNRRKALMTKLPSNIFSARLLVLLVADSQEFYRHLLDQDQLRPCHLAPLFGRPPDSDWIALARLALDAGHDARSIAQSAFQNSGAYERFGIEHWKKWEEPFLRLLETASGNLKEVAHCGLEEARARLTRAKEREHQFNMTGNLLSGILHTSP